MNSKADRRRLLGERKASLTDQSHSPRQSLRARTLTYERRLATGKRLIQVDNKVSRFLEPNR